MAFPKGRKRPDGAGRKQGTPNKVTRDVRAAIAAFASNNADKLEAWIAQVDDPAKRVDLYLRAIEYHIPKLARTETSGPDGGPQRVEYSWAKSDGS